MMQSEAANSLESLYFGAEMHERAEIERLESLLDGVRTFVDVGAALGQYTFHAGRVIRGGKIIAIEADPDRFCRLEASAEEWSRSSTNRITAVHAAVADKRGRISFFVNNETSGAPFTVKVAEYDIPGLQWREMTVNADTLDELLRDDGPDFIKMDIEGFEYRALLGAEQILPTGRCRFLVEVHPWGDPTLGKGPADVFALFYQHGYDFRRAHRHWLFVPSTNRTKTFLKYHFVRVILRNRRLKSGLKRFALKLDAMLAASREA